MKIEDFLKKLENYERKNKLKKKFWMVFQAPLFFSILFSLNRGIQVSQFVRPAWNGYSPESAQVTLIRYPLSGIKDTVRTTVWYGMWATDGANFIPPLSPGNKLEARIAKNGYTARYIDSIPNNSSHLFPDVHMDDPYKSVLSFTPNIATIIDTIPYINVAFYGVFFLKKNPEQCCTAAVDTTINPDRVWDYFVNSERQDSIFRHGDSAYIQLEKIWNGIRYFTKIGFTIDTTRGRAMFVKSQGNTGSYTIYFPSNRELIGINEINKVKSKTFKAYPTITTGKVYTNIRKID
ncbi:MAG: hypothetical protein N3A69_06630, partial [Leptospiraceae bacterium]|nr:hypothetical protein [Leptospiraceae bacterium]